MEIDQLAVVVRPRRPWEAVDLGFSLVQANVRPLLRSWLVVFVPVVAALVGWMPDPTWAVWLALWWLKPLFDIAALHVLSRRVFSQPTPAGSGLGALRRHIGLLIASLTYQRFSPSRSFHLPIALLEGAIGANYRARVRVLDTRTVGTATLLTGLCFLLEAAALLGLFGLVYLLTPESLHPEFWRPLGSVVPSLGNRVGLMLYAAALSLVEPYYVAAGFALYLNRRTMLEGWDLALALRRLGDRLRLAAVPMLVALLVAGAAIARADTTTVVRADSSRQLLTGSRRFIQAHRAVDSTLADSSFGFIRKEEIWSWISQPDSSKPDTTVRQPSALPKMLSMFFRLLAWLIVAGIIGALVWWIVRNRETLLAWLGLATPEPETVRPTHVAGFDIRPESLPTDVPDAARALWAAGDPVAALSLLYRGALSALVNRRGLRVPSSATEGDCLRLVRARESAALADGFGCLTSAWQSAAYARRLADEPAFAALCDEWPRLFAARAPVEVQP